MQRNDGRTTSKWEAHASERPQEEQMERDEQPIDRSPNSGATDEEHATQDQETNRPRSRHEYTPNQTFIGGRLPSTTDSDVETLNELNKETYNISDEPVKQNRREHDILNDIEAWGRQIGLTQYEIERAQFLYNERNPLQHQGPIGKDTTALACLTIAANENTGRNDEKIIRKSHETIAKESEDIGHHAEMIAEYERIRDSLDNSRSNVRQARKYIRDQM